MKFLRTIALGASLTLLVSGVLAGDRTGILVGLSSDLFSVPLSETSCITRSTAVTAGYAINSELHVDLSLENRLQLDTQQFSFDSFNGLGLGVGYRLRNSPVEFTVLMVKGLSDISSSKNFAAQGGVNWLFSDHFYLGTGLRYDSWESNRLIQGEKGSYNWYCKLGIRIQFGKKK